MRRAALALLLVAVAAPAIASYPDVEEAWNRGDRREAGRIIRDHLRRDPSLAGSAEVSAWLARTAQSPAEAVARWEDVLAQEPGSQLGAEALFAKAVHEFSAGLYVSAARDFDELAGHRKFDEGVAMLWKGRAELGADAPEAAQESFEKARRVSKDAADVRSAEIGLAHAAFAGGNLGDALRRYQKFEKDHPADGRADAAARRAVECLRMLGRTGEASAEATRIERTYPDSPEATLARDQVTPVERVEEAPQHEDAAAAVQYLVQVAALADLSNAVSLRREIRALGLADVRIEMTEGVSGTLHRVLLGPYPSRERAEAVADSVAALGDLNPRVREVDAGSSR